VFRLGRIIGSSSLEYPECGESQSSLGMLDEPLLSVLGSSAMILVSARARPLASMLKVTDVRVPGTDSGIELRLMWFCFTGDILPPLDVALLSVIGGLEAIVVNCPDF
jgi:hypothetical protein